MKAQGHLRFLTDENAAMFANVNYPSNKLFLVEQN